MDDNRKRKIVLDVDDDDDDDKHEHVVIKPTARRASFYTHKIDLSASNSKTKLNRASAEELASLTGKNIVCPKGLDISLFQAPPAREKRNDRQSLSSQFSTSLTEQQQRAVDQFHRIYSHKWTNPQRGEVFAFKTVVEEEEEQVQEEEREKEEGKQNPPSSTSICGGIIIEKPRQDSASTATQKHKKRKTVISTADGEERVMMTTVYAKSCKQNVDFGMLVGELGSGKTHVVGKVLCDLGPEYCAIVVCPSIIARATYRNLHNEYGVPFWGYLSYESFQCGKRIPNANPPLRVDLLDKGFRYTGETTLVAKGLLFRDRYKKLSENEHVLEELVFRLSEPAKQLFAPHRKFFVIFDEFQAVKNTNGMRWFAIRAFIRQCVRANLDSRMAFLSGTPFDKNEQITGFFRLTGVIQHRYLCGPFHTRGWSDLHMFARCIAPQQVDTYDASHRADDIRNLCPDLQHKKVLDFFVQTLQADLEIPLCLEGNEEIHRQHEYIRHHYCITRKEDADMLEEGMSTLRAAHAIMEINRFGEDYLKALEQFTVGCRMIECAKLDSVARHIIHLIQQGESTGKFVIAVNYVAEHMDMLIGKLRAYKPLELSGRIRNEKERQRAIELFNRNDSEFRILLLSIPLGSRGISLHDVNGSFPRTMFLFLSYKFMDVQQAIGRVIRYGMKSPARIICVCARKAESEVAFLYNMAAKQDVQSIIVDKVNGKASTFNALLEWKTTKQVSEAHPGGMLEDNALKKEISDSISEIAKRRERSSQRQSEEMQRARASGKRPSYLKHEDDDDDDHDETAGAANSSVRPPPQKRQASSSTTRTTFSTSSSSSTTSTTNTTAASFQTSSGGATSLSRVLQNLSVVFRTCTSQNR